MGKFLILETRLLFPNIFKPCRFNFREQRVENYKTCFIRTQNEVDTILSEYGVFPKKLKTRDVDFYSTKSNYAPTLTVTDKPLEGYKLLKELKDVCEVRNLSPDQFFTDAKCDLICGYYNVYHDGREYSGLSLNEVLLTVEEVENILNKMYGRKAD